ncbi:MAG: SCO1664 family protein [Acidimicrobiales bacterium]
MALRSRMPWSSNATLLVEMDHGGLRPDPVMAIYKPEAGERPLWDYPRGLWRREVAAWKVDQILGWDLVPTTVESDGPLGLGSVQELIAAEPEEHYFSLVERPQHHPVLMRMAVFDLLINNGDRKAGHCLLGPGDRVWGIDHGLCLHADPKLRTVIWDFGGRAIPEDLLVDVDRLGAHPSITGDSAGFAGLLSPAEIAALARRAQALVARPTLPPLVSGRSLPWPLI